MGDPGGDWKRRVLEDFTKWLDELPEGAVDGATGEAPAPDLHGLLSALVSLRQEVRLQSREQARATRGLEKAEEACEAAAELFRARSEDFPQLEARVRQEAERRWALAFLEVRDALVRGHGASCALAVPTGLFRRRPAGIDGVVQGYEMALDRFDRALSELGVTQVPTVGHRFDPRTMVALAVRNVEGAADEEVVEEAASGFARGEEVLRPAEVVVNRTVESRGTRDES